jgi:hypothetical protein
MVIVDGLRFTVDLFTPHECIPKTHQPACTARARKKNERENKLVTKKRKNRCNFDSNLARLASDFKFKPLGYI